MKNNNTIEKARFKLKLKKIIIRSGLTVLILLVVLWIFTAVGIHLGDIASQL